MGRWDIFEYIDSYRFGCVLTCFCGCLEDVGGETNEEKDGMKIGTNVVVVCLQQH